MATMYMECRAEQNSHIKFSMAFNLKIFQFQVVDTLLRGISCSLITLDQGLQKEEFTGGYGFHLAVVIHIHCAALHKVLLQGWLHLLLLWEFYTASKYFQGCFWLLSPCCFTSFHQRVKNIWNSTGLPVNSSLMSIPIL